MRYTPEPQDNRGTVMSGLFLIVGAVLMLAAPMSVVGRGIIQVIAVCMFTASIFLMIRYRMTRFAYSICGRDQDPGAVTERAVDVLTPDKLDFVVQRIQGKRMPVTECRLGIECLSAVQIITSDDQPKLDGVVKKYNYCISFQPKRRCCLIFDEPVQGKIAVFVELNDKMEGYLTDVVERKNYT